jgi:hypothetical protein
MDQEKSRWGDSLPLYRRGAPLADFLISELLSFYENRTYG